MAPLALVTGASSGLGRALAIELAARGREVLLLARDGERLATVEAEIRGRGGRARSVSADVRDEAALRRALDAALSGCELDRVLHAAGVLALGSIDELSSDDFRRCLEVNALGSAHVVRATLAHLERTKGRIGLVSSIAGTLALPGGFSAYSASKYAVRGMAEVLRPELAARGVRIMVASPSILDTPMLEPLGDGAPDVYRAFPWHSAESAAARIVDDLERGRRESFLTLGDRIGARLAGACPATFTAALHWWVRLRGRRTRRPADR